MNTKAQSPKPKAQKPLPTKEEIISILREHLPELRRDYNVSYLGLFGSYVRGEQRQRSDVDLLFDVEGPMGLFRYVELENRLSRIVGRKVDLVMRGSMKPVIGIFVRREVFSIE